MNRAQIASHKRAEKLIAMFENGDTSKDIAAAMGWNTDWPSHMVTKEIRRLRERGYEVGKRGCKRKGSRFQ